MPTATASSSGYAVFTKLRRQTCVVHGERDASDALRLRIQDELGWRVQVPEHGACVEF